MFEVGLIQNKKKQQKNNVSKMSSKNVLMAKIS